MIYVDPTGLFQSEANEGDVGQYAGEGINSADPGGESGKNKADTANNDKMTSVEDPTDETEKEKDQKKREECNECITLDPRVIDFEKIKEPQPQLKNNREDPAIKCGQWTPVGPKVPLGFLGRGPDSTPWAGQQLDCITPMGEKIGETFDAGPNTIGGIVSSKANKTCCCRGGKSDW